MFLALAVLLAWTAPPSPTVEIWDVRDDVPGPRSAAIAPPTVRDDPPAPPGAHTASPPVPEPWASLAACESGDWIDRGAAFVPGSARWGWGADLDALPPWASTIDRGDGVEAQFHGGLQHHPDTWRWIAGDLGLLDEFPYAYLAPPAVQIAVATEVQARQGWGAWPVCSRLVGLR